MRTIKFAGLALSLLVSIQAARAAPPRLPVDALPVPLVVQATDYSCGAGSLLSVLYYWHAYDGVETHLYEKLQTTPKDGTEPGKIAEVAASQGLSAELRTGMTLDNLREALALGAPVILSIQSGTTSGDWKDEWSNGHYVVLVGMDREYAYLMDPAVEAAYVYVPLHELEQRWHDYENRTGQVIRYNQAGIIVRGKNPRRAFPGPLVRLGEGR